MDEIVFIQKIQQVFDSQPGRLFVVFLARWLIFFYVPLAALAAWSGWRKHDRQLIYKSAWSGFVALTAAKIISYLIGRVRPFRATVLVEALIPSPFSAYAMPSGHAATAFAIATSLTMVHPWFGVVGFLVAFGVAFGRVAAGVHYPSDVAAGALLGILCGFGVRFAYRKWHAWHTGPVPSALS